MNPPSTTPPASPTQPTPDNPAVPASSAPWASTATGAWATTPTGAHVGLAPVASAFRRPPPARTTAEPGARRLVAVCLWAAVLGIIGVLVGLRGWFAIITETAPTWYLAALCVLGIVGIAFTAGSFLTVHQRRMPWLLLSTGSLTLSVSMAVTASI